MASPLSRRDALRSLGMAAGSFLSLPSWASTTEEGLPILLPEIEIKLDKPITVITLGAGNRGNVYGNYALKYPEQMDVIGVAEPIAIRKERYATKHNITAENQFQSWEEVFKKPKFADAVIISTPDQLHYGPCMKALEMGYDVLLEKPISPSEQECRNILQLAKKTGRIVAVCHVLRYAPYFIKLRELMQSGAIGEVISVQHLEPIGHVHMSHSYVRGVWHDSKKNTPIILAKSCHDLDIIRWLVGKPCKNVQAYGSLKWFKQSNAPEGSTNRCTDGCKIEGTCPYSALRIYYRNRSWLHHFDLPEDKSQQGDAILKYLKESDFGKCVYQMDNDQPDHYTTNLLFDEEITASFNMEAFTSYEGRRTRVMGSMGDIVGDMNHFTLSDFRTGEKTEWKETSDMHGGGDWRLVANWIQAITKKDPSLLTSTIDQSIESHIMGFMAEESRKTKRVMEVKM